MVLSDGTNFSYTDIAILARRWDQLVGDLNYPSRRLAIKFLYHAIAIWLDGRGLSPIDSSTVEVFSKLGSEVGIYVTEYPHADKILPNLAALNLTLPMFFVKALENDISDPG